MQGVLWIPLDGSPRIFRVSILRCLEKMGNDIKIKNKWAAKSAAHFISYPLLGFVVNFLYLYFYKFHKLITVDLHVAAKNPRLFIPGSRPMCIRI